MSEEIPAEVRKRAAEQWDWRELFFGGQAHEPADIPVFAVLFVVLSVLIWPLIWAWRRFVRKPSLPAEQFVVFHADQMWLLMNLYLALSLLTCCLGFPLFLLPALLVIRAGRRGAERGEWWRVPLVGWVLGRGP